MGKPIQLVPFSFCKIHVTLLQLVSTGYEIESLADTQMSLCAKWNERMSTTVKVTHE